MGEQRDAVLSPCGNYRLELSRLWKAPDSGADVCPLVFLMLNPSTADAAADDPTIRRCRGFAKSLGFDGFIVVNLFAWRSSIPEGLLASPDPVGAGNDAAILRACSVGPVVCAWGAQSDSSLRRLIKPRVKSVVSLLANHALFCLGRTQDGSPRHPLYMPASSLLHPWRPQ